MICIILIRSILDLWNHATPWSEIIIIFLCKNDVKCRKRV